MMLILKTGAGLHVWLMTQAAKPALFISHGAPDLAVTDMPARRFLESLGPRLGRPDAIVIASAHDERSGITVRAPARFRTWHDFRGFPPELYAMRYEPAGAERLADEVEGRLRSAGLAPRRDDDDRLDHGAWIPLSLLFPAADIPLVAVSIDPDRDAAWHERLGGVLAPLRAGGVLLIGSGSITHNLRAVFSATPGTDRRWVDSFTQWLETAIRTGDRDRVLAAMDQAPEARRNHPTDEHLLPLFFAFGAGGAGRGRRIHHSHDRQVLAMDAYAFGDDAAVARLG